MAYQLLLLLTVLCASTHLQMLLEVYAGESTSTSASTEEVRAVSSRRMPKNNLTCYVCHSETQSDCMNFTGDDSDDGGDLDDKLQRFETPCEEKETSCICYNACNNSCGDSKFCFNVKPKGLIRDPGVIRKALRHLSNETSFENLSSVNVQEHLSMVKKISFTTSTGNHANTTLPMKTVAVKRNCTRKCEPGCVIMGERTRLYVCSTCCTNNLCNIGSGASPSISVPNFRAAFIRVTVPIFIFNFFNQHFAYSISSAAAATATVTTAHCSISKLMPT